MSDKNARKFSKSSVEFDILLDGVQTDTQPSTTQTFEISEASEAPSGGAKRGDQAGAPNGGTTKWHHERAPSVGTKRGRQAGHQAGTPSGRRVQPGPDSCTNQAAALVVIGHQSGAPNGGTTLGGTRRGHQAGSCLRFRAGCPGGARIPFRASLLICFRFAYSASAS